MWWIGYLGGLLGVNGEEDLDLVEGLSQFVGGVADDEFVGVGLAVDDVEDLVDDCAVALADDLLELEVLGEGLVGDGTHLVLELNLAINIMARFSKHSFGS